MSRRSLSFPAAGSVIPFADVGISRGSLAYPTVPSSLIPFTGAAATFDDDNLPWLVNVDVFMTAISHVNWDTNTQNINFVYNGYRASSGAQNDELNFDVVLAAGTWTFELIHSKDTSRGIYSVQLDGVEKGTIDGYNSSTQFNQRSQVTGISVATSGKVRLKLKMATKNASSSNYYGRINHLQFKRTA